MVIIMINSDIMMIYGGMPSGKHLQFANWKIWLFSSLMTTQLYSMVMFHSFVCLPEDINPQIQS